MTELKDMEKFLVAEILEDCLQRIQIIGELVIFSKEKVENDIENISDEGKRIFQSAADLTSEEKLNADRNMIETALKAAIQEIKTCGTFKSLKTFNEDYEKGREQYKEFHNRVLEQQQTIPKMKQDIVDAKQKMQSDIDDVDCYVHHLNFELQKMKAHFDMEKMYLKKECDNTIKRTIKMCSLAEKEVDVRIENLRKRLAYEAQADENISNYWKQVEEQELLDILKYWKFKFYDDQLQKEKEIQTLKKYKALNLTKMEAVSQKLKVAEDFLEEDRKEKQAEQERLEYEKLKEKASVQVQAWWRGVMVRRKLGPYAPKKKEKKPKKGKKGKKK